MRRRRVFNRLVEILSIVTISKTLAFQLWLGLASENYQSVLSLIRILRRTLILLVFIDKYVAVISFLKVNKRLVAFTTYRKRILKMMVFVAISVLKLYSFRLEGRPSLLWLLILLSFNCGRQPWRTMLFVSDTISRILLFDRSHSEHLRLRSIDLLSAEWACWLLMNNLL